MYKLLDNVNFYSAEEVEQRFSNESAVAEKERALAAEKVLQENIDKEQARAEAAEAEITAEQARAEAAEAEITGKVTAEQTRAEAAENALSGRLDSYTTAVSDEQARAEDAEAKLKEEIDKEPPLREAGDTALQNNIEAEQVRAEAAETKLTEDLAAETARATAAETTEKERAEAAEATLQQNITAEETRATEAEAEITGKVTAEKERAEAAETKLTEDLAAETARATAAEQANTDAIQAEATRASQEEGKISNSVIKETARATKAESNITRHVFLVYNTQAELPTVQKDPNTSVTIYTGQLAYIIGSKSYYSATVTGGAVTWQELSISDSFITIPAGTILQGLYTTAPSGFLLCNGQEVAITEFPILYNIIGTLEGCQSENEGMFKVPDLRGRFLEGANGNLGKRIEAGLPNIEGEVGYINSISVGAYERGINHAKGCFGKSKNIVSVPPAVISMSTNSPDNEGNTGLVVLDANISSPIYGNSGTVQPNSICVNYIIKY